MAVELKDLAEYLGYDDAKLAEIEDADALKSELDKQFIRRDNALKDKEFLKAASGKLLNSLQTKFTSIAKDNGIEFAPDEVKDVALEKVFELGFSKLVNASTTALEEVKKQIGKPDEVVKDLTAKMQLVQKERDDFKGLLENTKTEFTTFKEQKESEIKNAKLNFQREQVLSNIPWKAGIKDIEKQGFLAIVDKSVKFDFDTDGKFVIKDLNGDFIKSNAKHGEFVSPEEYLKELGLKSEVIAVNQHGGKPAPKPFNPPPPQNGNGHQEQPQGRKINPYRPVVTQR